MKVKMYAVLKDYFSQTVELSADIVNISDLKTILENQNPSAKVILNLSRFAVADTFVSLDYSLKGGEIVSVIPPSSGG